MTSGPQVVLEHHVDSVTGCERILDPADRRGAEAEVKPVISHV
jgi:hypothetical protein